MTVRTPARLDEHGENICIDFSQIGDCLVAAEVTVVVDEALYYARLNEVKRDRKAQQKAQEKHRNRVTQGVEIIKA